MTNTVLRSAQVVAAVRATARSGLIFEDAAPVALQDGFDLALEQGFLRVGRVSTFGRARVYKVTPAGRTLMSAILADRIARAAAARGEVKA
jgi:hypothetical protein